MTSNDPTIRLQRWLSAAILAITLLVLILPLGAIQQSAAQTSDEPPPSGDVIVVLADHASPMAVTEASSALDNVVPDQVYTSVFNGFSATVTQAEANALADDPRVEAIYPDGVFYQAAQTVPTGVERIGNLNNPSADIDGIDDVRINADIAILDTGVSDTTSDLNLVGGVNCVDKTGETGLPYSFDGTGHGTHVAGIAAALDNDRGVVGVAPGARVYSVRVLASNGTGLESWLICGLDWVLKRSSTIDVVNMSIQGSGDDGDCDSSALHLAICQVVNDAGVPVVVAAGNSHQDAESTIPATFDQVIAVSNMADYDGLPGGLATMGPNGCPKAYGDDTLSGTSNFGPDVDIAAPGTCILSLVPGGGTTFKSGTSMASPHVAGAVALYKAVNPRATPSGVRAWLLNTAKAQSSDQGFGGDPDSFHEPLLWLGDGSPVVTATPTTIPTTSYRLIRSAASPQSAASTYVRDGKLNTVWATKPMSAGPPAEAWVWVDLGNRLPVGTIRWVFGQEGIADYFEIEGSNNLQTWAFITKRKGHAIGDWQEKTLKSNFRYIRFRFSNPHGDLTLGGIAEIQVYAPNIAPPLGSTATPTRTATATTTPPPNGNYKMYGVARSSNSSDPYAVTDYNLTTTWQSASDDPPGVAWLYVSLGNAKPIEKIRWYYGTADIGNHLTIEVSNNKVDWTEIYSDENNSAAGIWFETSPSNVFGKYVRWNYTNAEALPVIGGLAEVEVYAPGTGGPTATLTQTPTATLTATGRPVLTETPTATETASETFTPAAESSAIVTETPTETAIAPETATETASPTETAADTETVSPTETSSASATVESSGPATETLSPSATETSGVANDEATATAVVTKAPAVTPTPYVLTGLTRSTNSTEGANAVDANPETVWTITDDGSSPIGGLILDYGQILPIGMIRALPGNGGLRGEGVIQVSPDGIAWHTYGTLPQDAVAEPDGWIVIMPTGPEPVPTTTRYVRVVYLLAGGEVAVANIAEVEMLPPNP